MVCERIHDGVDVRKAALTLTELLDIAPINREPDVRDAELDILVDERSAVVLDIPPVSDHPFESCPHWTRRIVQLDWLRPRSIRGYLGRIRSTHRRSLCHCRRAHQCKTQEYNPDACADTPDSHRAPMIRAA